MLGIKAKLSTAYHPQTDGQTKRVNQILEESLRFFVNYHQDDWSNWLPLAQFSYNATPHESTGQSPFYVNFGFNPRVDVILMTTPSRSAEELVRAIHNNQASVKSALRRAIDRYKFHANKKRKDAPEIHVGNKVFLKTRNMKLSCPRRELAEKALGPYKVKGKVSDLVFELKLLRDLAGLHNMFHVLILEKTKPDTIEGRRQAKPGQVVLDQPNRYLVEAILDSRWRSGWLEVLARWEGYNGPFAKDWIPLPNAEDA